MKQLFGASTLRRGIAAACGLALSGCATRVDHAPPLLSLAGDACTVSLKLDDAASLPADGESLTVTIDENARCVTAADGRLSSYRVFALPTDAAKRMLTVASAPLGESLFAAEVLLLDDKGMIRRQIIGDAFVFRGTSQQVTVRLQAVDRFVVVRSDPQRVGNRISRINGSVQTAVIPIGLVYIPISRGTESEQTLTYSHRGTVTLTSELMQAAR